MPTYEYKCANCEHKFEKFQSISASPSKKCPNCGKMKLNRLIGTGAGIIFKGSGFYETDYRDKSYTEAASKDKETTKTDSAKSSGDNSKTETKSTEKKSKSKATEKKTA